jgi:hypothetical protein
MCLENACIDHATTLEHKWMVVSTAGLIVGAYVGYRIGRRIR